MGTVALQYDRRGAGGRPAFVILHGGSGSRRDANGLVSHLPSTWDVVVPDLRGHGSSPATPGRYDLRSTADDVAALLDALALSGAVVMGHSFGGHVALVLAHDHPQQVGALVVGDAPLDLEVLRRHVTGNRATTQVWRAMASSADDVDSLASQLEDLPVQTPSGTVPASAVFGSGHPWFGHMAANLHQHDPAFLDALLDDFDGLHAGFADLPRRDLPVLLLQGDPAAGGLLSTDQIAGAADAPHIDVVQLAGVGHGLHLQDPAAVAAAVVSWVQRLDRTQTVDRSRGASGAEEPADAVDEALEVTGVGQVEGPVERHELGVREPRGERPSPT